jgi:toxin FitB
MALEAAGGVRVTRYLLDTNVVSELRKLRPHGAVVAWMNSLAIEQVFISAVTFGEMQSGAERTRLQDSAKAVEIELWMDEFSRAYHVLPMDLACFLEWGRLKAGKPDRILEDAMIAATARVHDLVVATRNKSDFERLEVRIFNPFVGA